MGRDDIGRRWDCENGDADERNVGRRRPRAEESNAQLAGGHCVKIVVPRYESGSLAVSYRLHVVSGGVYERGRVDIKRAPFEPSHGSVDVQEVCGLLIVPSFRC